jgi:hypothetical protein
MNWRFFSFGLLFSLIGAAGLCAQEDPGKATVGRVVVTVYHATNGDPKAAGERAVAAPAEVVQRLQNEQRLRFEHYRQLGSDLQPLFRSYENWAQPLKPSDEVLVRFEAGSRPVKGAVRLDLELWLSRKKILKTNAELNGDRPLYVLGPEWRGGHLIIAIGLAPKPKEGQ